MAYRLLLRWVPLRVSITLWVLAMFGVVQLTLSLVFVLFHRQSVERQIRADLTAAAESLAGESISDFPEFLTLRVVQDAEAARWGPLASLVIDNDGEVLTRAGPYEDEEFDALVADAASRTPDGSVRLFDSEGGAFLYAITALADGQQLVVAAPTGTLRRTLDPVTTVLLLTLPIGLLSIGMATWYMSGVAVRPLRQVQSFAEELSADSIEHHIDFDSDSPETEHLKNELEAAMDRISEGYERQARFLANVSHELKTPISVVRTEAEVLLASRPDESEFRDFARSTSEEMDRLGRMIESFLLLTRIRHGDARIKAKRHAANDVLMEAVGHCAGMARQYGVHIVPTLDESEDELHVEGNADLLQTAIANLIRNAIRFSPRDERIEVRCESESNGARFTVIDRGPGVPEELLGRLFEPFTQADSERSRSRGTGLGLQIAQGIAELHGGRITVENLDVGCLFSITVPLAGQDRASGPV